MAAPVTFLIGHAGGGGGGVEFIAGGADASVLQSKPSPSIDARRYRVFFYRVFFLIKNSVRSRRLTASIRVLDEKLGKTR